MRYGIATVVSCAHPGLVQPLLQALPPGLFVVLSLGAHFFAHRAPCTNIGDVSGDAWPGGHRPPDVFAGVPLCLRLARKMQGELAAMCLLIHSCKIDCELWI